MRRFLWLGALALFGCVTTDTDPTLELVAEGEAEVAGEYLCTCFATGEQICHALPYMPSCESQYSCLPVPSCGGGNPFPKRLSHAIVRKLEGDGCTGPTYAFISQAFYGHAGKGMDEFDLGFSPTDSCSLSIALIRTEKAGWINRNWWDIAMEWRPLNDASKTVCLGPSAQVLPVNTVRPEDLKVNPETLAYSAPITIAPSAADASCQLEFHRPTEVDKPCKPWPFCNHDGRYSKLDMSIMFKGPGAHQCDIKWLIDVDPTKNIFRSVPEESKTELLFTFKQPMPTAACTIDFHTTRFFRPN